MGDTTNTERLDAVIRMTAERMRSGATPIVSIYNALVDLRAYIANDPSERRLTEVWNEYAYLTSTLDDGMVKTEAEKLIKRERASRGDPNE